MELDMYEFVPDEYRRERYEACYAHMIFPVNGRSLWQRTAYTDLQPPPIRRQPGRPKKKRTKDPSEMLRDDSQMKRARYGIKCSRCKSVGHNKSTCKLPPPPAETQATDNPSTNQPQPTDNATTITQPPVPTQNQSTTSATTTNTVIQQPHAPTHNQSTTSTNTTCSQPPFTQTFSTQDSTNAQTSAKPKSQANKKQGGASKANSAATAPNASKKLAATSKTKATATNVAATSKRGPNTTRQKLPFKRGQTSATQPPSK